jgi:N-glycosylase/DNA lyase
MIRIDPGRLEYAVCSIASEVHDRITRSAIGTRSDRALWREFACCVLSSQVAYQVAISYAERIDAANAMAISEPSPAFIRSLLEKPVHTDGRTLRYRFPASKAEQLWKSCARIRFTYGSLSGVLEALPDPFECREWLVKNAPGLGPKQASMFLRNATGAYDLAVLDRHVLRYMAMTRGFGETCSLSTNSLGPYQRREAELRRHAEQVGYPVGILDWAIWIVMRTAASMN